MEVIVFVDKTEINPVYSFEHKLDWTNRIEVRDSGQAGEGRAAGDGEGGAQRVYRTRVPRRGPDRLPDGRQGEDPYFLECNPLPGLDAGLERSVPDRHGFGEWRLPRTLIGEILSGAVRRYKERERERARGEGTPLRGAASEPMGFDSKPGNGGRQAHSRRG